MKRLDDISILRVLCILVVVFFHCYGMMYADAHFPDTVSMYESLYFIPNQCIFINIAMPMFVFVSGYLFEYLLFRGKYPTWGNLLQKKGIRILLPYFVFGQFFMATTGNWHPLRLLNGGYWHLWFLPMLFWCFIVGYGMFKLQCKIWQELILLTITFSTSLMPKFIPMWFGLHNITIWSYWFYLGMLCYKYRDTLSSYLGKYKFSILLLICSIAIIVLFPVEYGESTWYGNLAVTCCIVSISCLMSGIDWSKYKFSILLLICSIAIIVLFPVEYGESTWYGNLAVTCCVVSLSCLMSGIDWSKYKMTASVIKFGTYSFGIYIWHNWVALMLVSKTSQRIFGLPELAANHVILYPLCFSLITLAISWGLSWAMMKTKVGRFLIG